MKRKGTSKGSDVAKCKEPKRLDVKIESCADDAAVQFDDSVVPQLAKNRFGVDVLPVDSFSFFIISKGRASNVRSMHAIFGSGVIPTWIVGTGEVHYIKLQSFYRLAEACFLLG